MRLRTRALALVVLAGLAAAACGGDDDDDATAAPSSSTQAPSGSTAPTTSGGGAATTSGEPNTASDVGITETEVRVSIVQTETGQSASAHNVWSEGFEAYIEMINEQGGVNGRTIKIVSVRDDTGDTARNAAEIRSAFEQDQSFAVVGSWPNFGAAEYAQQNGLPIIGYAVDSNWERCHSCFSFLGASWFDKTPDEDVDPPPSPLNAYIAAKMGVDKVGVFGYNHSQSASSAETVCRDVEHFGLECVYQDTSLPFGYTDLGASLERIRSSGVGHVYAAMDIAGSMTALRSLKRAGLNDVTILSAVGYGPDTIENFPDLIENLFIALSIAPFEAGTPEMEEFLTELAARKPGVDADTITLNGWLGGIMLVEGLKAAGQNPTRKSFVDNLRAMENYDANGLISGVNLAVSNEERWRDPNYEPDPDLCTTFLMRVDVAAKKWVQVGEKPRLCLNNVRTAEDLQRKLAEDTSSLEP